MGIARLLAKGWAVFCVFAGAQALGRAVLSGDPQMAEALLGTAIPVFLFGAMGLLFVAGYGLSSGEGLIEAVRYRRAPFVVGVQWHPEFHRAGGDELLDCTPILDTFLRAARETRL